MIFEGFQLATRKNVPKEIAGLLVDEEFGSDVLREAKKEGLMFAMPVEKSVKTNSTLTTETISVNTSKSSTQLSSRFWFDTILKRLAMNKRQLQRLKKLSDYLAQKKRPLPFRTNSPLNACTTRQVGRIERKI